MNELETVNIRPGVNVLSVLPHLNYKAWFALAEFVDNSIQSSITRRKELDALSDGKFKLCVEIDFDPVEKRISIKDNAAGIASGDYQRAFRPADIPPDASGLSEFGMGMKSAACWFSPNWSACSSAIGERLERTVFFDINKIVRDSIEELDVVSIGVAENRHYTEIRLENIRKFPRGRTIAKIKEHLSSIYRNFFREDLMDLYVDGEKLEFTEPAILQAPSFRDPDGQKLEWKKKIEIDLGEGRSASGFVAIREVGSTRLAGLSLFRRNRLVLGSADETYRPEDIFGRSNTYPYQRLFGEIHLRGFFISHTKDGVKWEECEEDFLSKLRKVLSSEDLPIIPQAREYRTNAGAKAARKTASKALKNTAEGLSTSLLNVTDRPINSENWGIPKTGEQNGTPASDFPVDSLPKLSEGDVETAEVNLTFRGDPWIVKIELSYAEDQLDWLSISDRPSITDPDPRQVQIRIAMLHPFMVQFPMLDADGFSAILKLAATLALAEVIASELAERSPTSIRRFSNEILKTSMSKHISHE
jgi:hypothetical protein